LFAAYRLVTLIKSVRSARPDNALLVIYRLASFAKTQIKPEV